MSQNIGLTKSINTSISLSKQQPKQQGTSNGFWDIISNNEAVFMFALLILAILVGIILTGIFQAGPAIRSNLLFNAMGAIGMAVMFIFIIFKFLGAKIRLLGVSIDVGLIIYIMIVCFVIFVLGG